MRIDSSDRISNIPILTIRKFLRRISGFIIDIEFIKKFLNTADNNDANNFLSVLIEHNFIEFVRERDGNKYYELTGYGNRFAKSTARKPILRKTAERLIKEFVERSHKVREDPYFLYKVKRAIVFGSYLTNKDKINDIDIAIELIPKDNDSDKHIKLIKKRIDEAQNKGRKFNSYHDALFWPIAEVHSFLRGRSPSISLEYIEPKGLENIDHKEIYSDM